MLQQIINAKSNGHNQIRNNAITMSADKPYYYWDPIGSDPEHSGHPEFVQLLSRTYEQWEVDEWGFPPNGLGDACWRLGLYVACHPEDELAIMSLFYMLDNRIRYFGDQPERQRKWYEHRRYKHPRHAFTRDQLIAGVFGLVVAGRIDLVKELKFPWFISRFQRTTISLRAWIRFLKTGEEKHARIFHLTTILEYFVHNELNDLSMFNRHLKSLMLFLCPDPDCSKVVMVSVPPENLLLHLLNDYDETHCLMIKPDEYVSRKGWQWQDDKLGRNNPIDEDDPIKLDKELLIKISEIWVKKKLKENPMSLLKAMFGNGSAGSIRN